MESHAQYVNKIASGLRGRGNLDLDEVHKSLRQKPEKNHARVQLRMWFKGKYLRF